MSMFSRHYLIRGPQGGYWNGLPLDRFSCWANRDVVRFFSRESAEAVLKGVLAPVADLCKIEEDE
jgi:hypothetical protein